MKACPKMKRVFRTDYRHPRECEGLDFSGLVVPGNLSLAAK